ncbi:hypothetical protein SDRG_10163 [Saprolegnia diclina VS20]|uniref:GOST seven transmembrane domain-containing protein n=1 Tax=Saprolegnia diclina (strain VS20) TaxID=1156394 RepID=T0RJ76_SAPDV|nr:hypothetical protein SDRG_10163 [Saprolegnia diclina VS20]EQC32423.1 hypothetical protein SDRG_10163 [Saprolegnia diclina VS20]|eukprot:XP_008614364.1 hypothetical protein SDRG_10163 [Saprolegnia diclina VS20]
MRSGIFLALAVCFGAMEASIHVVDGPAVGWKASERMFHSEAAADSWVHVDFLALPIEDELDPTSEYAVAVVIYTDDDTVQTPDDYCSQDYNQMNTSNLTGKLFLPSDNSTVMEGKDAFVVSTTGVQTVVIVTCARPKCNESEPAAYLPYEENPNSAAFDLRAAIAFKNPYGYLPGLMWGLLPFSGSLCLAYLVADGVFLVLLFRNRHTLIRLHYFILLVLLLTTLETLLWYVTYASLNESGEALCCPYPKMIVASTLLKVFSKLIARVLTMIICLGYGIARPSLTCAEIALVTGLGLCYIVSTGALEITHLSNQSAGDVSPPLVWELLATATDGCFAGWIFTSLMLTRKTLRATGQSAKYKMYDTLFTVLVTFMAITFLFTVFENAVYSKRIELSWDWMWVLWASSRALNFCVVFVVSIIWRPTRTSLLYAHSVQVPSSEADCPSTKAGDVELVVVEETSDTETEVSLHPDDGDEAATTTPARDAI